MMSCVLGQRDTRGGTLLIILICPILLIFLFGSLGYTDFDMNRILNPNRTAWACFDEDANNRRMCARDLLIACENNNINYVREKISANAELVNEIYNFEYDPWMPARWEDDSWTLLLIACEKGHTELVSLLLDHGANPVVNTGETEDGHTSCLVVACENGHLDVCKLLLDTPERAHQLLHRQNVWTPPLLKAACARRDQHGIVSCIVQTARQLNILDDVVFGVHQATKDNALHSAVGTDIRNTAGLELLLNSVANSNNFFDFVNAKNLLGHTPLHVACRYNHISAIRVLLDNNAVTHAVDMFGETALHHMLWRFQAETVKANGGESLEAAHGAMMLVADGADLCATNLKGKTPLDYITVDVTDLKSRLRDKFEEVSAGLVLK
jgi:ankyrin repeat protein